MAKNTETPRIIEAITLLDPNAAILATDHNPESATDLLVVGEMPRDVYIEKLNESAILAHFTRKRSDDALIITADNGSACGVAYYEQKLFSTRIQAIAMGREVDPIVKPWSVGPWLPEAFAADLSQAHVLRSNPAVEKKVAHFTNYPEGMRQGILQRCIEEITIKANRMGRTAETVKDLAFTQTAADICMAGIRVAHARERVYFRGLRYVDETIPKLSEGGRAIASELSTTANYRVALELINLGSRQQ